MCFVYVCVFVCCSFFLVSFFLGGGGGCDFNFEKKSADDNKIMKNYPACKELNESLQ